MTWAVVHFCRYYPPPPTPQERLDGVEDTGRAKQYNPHSAAPKEEEADEGVLWSGLVHGGPPVVQVYPNSFFLRQSLDQCKSLVLGWHPSSVLLYVVLLAQILGHLTFSIDLFDVV